MAKMKPVFSLSFLRWRRSMLVAAVAAIPGVATAADAADKNTANPSTEENGWIISIGGMAMYGPQYIGAKKFGPGGTPFFSFRRPAEKQDFSSPDDSFDYTLYGTNQFRFGAVGNVRQGRSTQNDERLSGLSNFPWVIEAGFFAELWPLSDAFRTRLEVRRGLKQGDGYTMDFSADGVRKFGSFTLSGGPRISMADNAIMNQQFGVTVQEATQNGRLLPFRAAGGIRSVGLAVSVDYDWSEQWQTTFYQRFDRLVGDAASSPVTRELGSKNQYTVGLGLTYSFRLNGL